MKTVGLMGLRLLWSKPFELTELTVRRDVPPVGAVYVIWPSTKQDKRLPLFVAHGQDVQRRLLEHLSGAYRSSALGALEDAGALVQFAPLEPSSTRRDVAQYLFRVLEPTANLRPPGGSPLQVNLPMLGF